MKYKITMQSGKEHIVESDLPIEDMKYFYWLYLPQGDDLQKYRSIEVFNEH